jgi:nucleoside-diphosphate-sugar epimerase
MTENVRVTVTGAKGYIGSALVHALRKKTPEIATIQEIDSAGTEDLAQDITTRACRDAIQEFDPDVIINLAGISGEGAAKEDIAQAWTVNARAPVLLFRTCPRALFIQAGTCSSYDRQARDSEYAYSKISAERGLAAESLGDGLVLFRFGTVVGPNHYGKMRWELPLHKMAFDAVDKGVIRIPDYRLDRPWLLLCDLIDAMSRLVVETWQGHTYYHPTPIPLVTTNADLGNMATAITKVVPARIEKVEGHKDNRNYSAVSLTGGHGMVPHFFEVLNALVEKAYEHSLISTVEADGEVRGGGPAPTSPDDGADGGAPEDAAR